MTKMTLFSWKSFLATITFIFGILICHYTGNRGVLPIDSFSHFDSGYRILNGEHPIKDYWIVSGFFVDYFQSLIFYFFDINWQTYLLNASFLNGSIALLFYYLLINFGLNFKYSFFYSICFSILAYPSSGTPFVDHHSTLLSITALIILINSMRTNNLYLWFLVPVFLFVAFLSKQVPASCVLLVVIFLSFLHFFHQDQKTLVRIFSTLIFSTLILITMLLIFFQIVGTDIKIFLTQYFYYPSSIGQERYKTISYDFKNTFLNFKFIYLSLFLLLVVTLKNIKKNKKNFYKDINFKILLICILTFIAFAHHNIFTKNQIFIFFLIPFILGLTSIQLNKFSEKYKKYFNIFLIIFCTGITIKYHMRFNIERKFHELNNVQFSKAVKAKIISNKFSGLNWITPDIIISKIKKEEAIEEIKFLKEFNEILRLDKSRKIILTNYSFFSVINDEKLSGYSRWYPGDNSAFPIKGNKYFEDYKKLILSFLKEKRIRTIYILPDIKETNFIDYVDSKCFNKKKLENNILKYEIVDKCFD